MRNLVITHERDGGEAPDALQAALELRVEQELVAGLDGPSKARLVDADKIETRIGVRHDPRSHEGENARDLCERLDDHDAGHYRTGRKVAGEERLVVGHVLQRPNALARPA